MATVVKDFKIKSGLVVEGTTGTINTYDILTKKQADQDYIIGLIGGTATSTNTADAVVKRDGSGNFAAGTITANLTGDVTGNVTGNLTGNADTATALETARTIELTGDVTGSVSFDGTGNVQISTTVDGSFATDTEVATAKGEAIADAQTYTDGRETAITAAYQSYADTAETDAVSTANAYTDGRETAITSAYQSYADTAETDAVSAAATYTDGEITTALTTAQGYANTAESNAESYADSLIGDNTVDGTAGNTVTDRIATAIADLVDSAPATLDTLNELAAALQDNPDVIGDLQGIAAGKQDTLTAGANIDITGATISVTGLDTDDVAEGTNLYFTDARATTANTGLWDTIGAAAAAQTAAETFATNSINALDTDDIEEGASNLYFTSQRALDATNSAYDAAGSADTAETNSNTYTDNAINALDTDDIEEGVANQYYTTERAQTDAASLLTGATLTNITITGNGSGLTITAENGVADSDTDDLTEGTTNLYFTDARAVDALEAVVPNFTAVEFNSVAKQVAAEATVATASTSNALTWAKADYRSAEFLVKIKQGTHTEVSKLVLTMDSSDNIAITEYAMVGTNGDLGSYSASISGDNVALTVTTLNNNSDVMVVGTLLK